MVARLRELASDEPKIISSARSLHFRYYAVTAPIKYSMHRDNHARAYIFIAVAWVASVAIGE